MNRKQKEFIKNLIPTLRIPSVTKISLERVLCRQFRRLKPGVVLDVGSSNSPYKKYIYHTKYMRLDIDKDSNPDICCDLHKIQWQSNYFDVVIATEVLEHLYEPQVAVNEIHRVIKPGGICILSTRFIFPYHPSPAAYQYYFGDYYRFTVDSLNYLFKEFAETEIHPHGNRIQAIWQIINAGGYDRRKFQIAMSVFLNIFTPIIARINFKDTRFPLGFVVYAKK
jgi:SAM-dependent methyltransferase